MGNLSLKALHLRSRMRATTSFLRQCFQELTSRGKKCTGRNSDLLQHNFASMPEPLRRTRKRLSLKGVRNRMQQKRRVKMDTFDTQLQRRVVPGRLVPVAVVALVLVLFFSFDGEKRVGLLFGDLSLFKVRNVQFVGCESTSGDRLRLLTGINLYQTSLLGLDTDSVAARIEQDPWISKAVVKTNWPSEIIIEVVEHRPVAMINKSTTSAPRLYYIDRNGIDFLEVGPGQDVDYPVITGLDRFAVENERKAIFSDIYTFLRLAGRNNPNLPAQSVSEIHVNEEGEMVVYLVDHTFPIFFGKGNIAEKYARLVKVLDVLYREKREGMLISGVAYIRMDYLNDKVLVAQSESG